MTRDSSTQRIARLTPLGSILALIQARVAPVAPQRFRPIGVEGLRLAEDVVASEHPKQAIALRDGFAINADAVADAGPYTPVPLTLTARRIDTGDPLPNGTDSVLPLDAVTLRGESAEATASVASGEGVLRAGNDTIAQTPLRHAGQRVRSTDIAVMSAANIDAVSIREPRIGVALGGVGGTPIINAALGMLVRLVFDAGGRVTSNPIMLDAALADGKTDAVIAIGGTGSGRRDSAVQDLASLGRVEAHGIAISPGETAAFGFIDRRPVLLVPGRLDAALAVWLLIGRHLIAKLAGGSSDDLPIKASLQRKVTSTIGMTEVIPVSCSDGMAEPLGSGYLSTTALARSDGWILIPADSEGFAAGSAVAVNPWP